MVLAGCQINTFMLKHMCNQFFSFFFFNESEESNPSEYPQRNSGLVDPVFLNEDNHLVFCTEGTSFISGS